MNLTNIYTWECTNCGELYATTTVGGMTANVCPECGEMNADGPEAQIVMNDSPATLGFFECFECGHTFGYSTGGRENPHSDPMCPECGADDVEQV